jgi:isoquinoline 1-oxidoreductase beta subunit
MSKITQNRRSFIKVSAAAGGGMLLGFKFSACVADPKNGFSGAPNPPQPDSWSELNGYLKIGENGTVTIMSPNPEIGQNVKTSMPMIVAEELDADWSKVIVEQAPLNTDHFSGQIAGGSQSIRRSWKRLREAGATARHLLLQAGSQKMEVPTSELSTEKGVIYHSDSDRSITYGEVASLAVEQKLPDEVALKDPKDFKIIGKGTKNVDGYKLVQGKPLFGIDTYEEGMLVAMIVHPPAFGKKIKSINDSDVRAMSGVQDIIRINIKPENWNPQWTDVNAYPELVVVVGNSTWQVLKAKKALDVEWEIDTDLESSSDHEKRMENSLKSDSGIVRRKDGDPEAGFAEATNIVEKTYTAPFLAHNTMERSNSNS